MILDHNVLKTKTMNRVLDIVETSQDLMSVMFHNGDFSKDIEDQYFELFDLFNEIKDKHKIANRRANGHIKRKF